MVIRQAHVKTALGGTQLTQPVIRLLYADDPKVREYFHEQLNQFKAPTKVLDTYFTAEQHGYTSLMVEDPNIDREFLRVFVPAADNMAYSFLRSYFGFGSAETDI